MKGKATSAGIVLIAALCVFRVSIIALMEEIGKRRAALYGELYHLLIQLKGLERFHAWSAFNCINM